MALAASTIDLQVYVYAVKDMLVGKDIFATTTPFWKLYFIYPPIAAVLMTPLAFGPYLMWRLVWTAGLIWAQQSVLRRCGVPRGWKLGLVGVAVVLAVEPIRTTLGYGQVNTLLMAFVVADLLPDAEGEEATSAARSADRAGNRDQAHAGAVRRLLLLDRQEAGRPHGSDQLRCVHRRQGHLPVLRDLGSWTGLSGGSTRTASPLYAGNQSLLGVFYRLGDTSLTTTLPGLAIIGIVALLGALIGAHWWRQGKRSSRSRWWG